MTNLLRILKTHFQRLQNHFQYKNLLTMLLVSGMPVLIAVFLVIRITSDNLLSQQVSAIQEESQVISDNLNQRISQLLLADQNVANYVATELSEVYSGSKPQSYSELHRLETFATNISNIEILYDLTRVQIYSDRIPFLSESNFTRFFSLQSLQERPIFATVLSKSTSATKLHYITYDLPIYASGTGSYSEGYLAFYHTLYNTDKTPLAVIMLICGPNSFLSVADVLENGVIAITDVDGELICTNANDQEYSAMLSASIRDDENYVVIDNNVLVRHYVPSLDWNLYVYLPLESNTDIRGAVSSTYIFVIVLTFIFAIVASIILSKVQTRRLRLYYNAIEKIDLSMPINGETISNELDRVISERKHSDEIDTMMISFSKLIRDNLQLISDMKEHDIEIEKYKFKVLQEQINPHFLYNALETLRLCMILGRNRDAIRSLDSLSKFYRIALSKGRDTISIREELDMITSYLEIENIGYNGAIRWNTSVDEDCLDMPIPKFLIQPLVENSILHSKKASDKEALTIWISIHANDGKLQMIISDDGIGIDADTLALIQAGLKNNTLTRGKNGFGLSNVNRRLKLFYGEQYGLQIQSDGNGTHNIIVLPLDVLW